MNRVSDNIPPARGPTNSPLLADVAHSLILIPQGGTGTLVSCARVQVWRTPLHATLMWTVWTGSRVCDGMFGGLKGNNLGNEHDPALANDSDSTSRLPCQPSPWLSIETANPTCSNRSLARITCIGRAVAACRVAMRCRQEYQGNQQFATESLLTNHNFFAKHVSPRDVCFHLPLREASQWPSGRGSWVAYNHDPSCQVPLEREWLAELVSATAIDGAVIAGGHATRPVSRSNRSSNLRMRRGFSQMR